MFLFVCLFACWFVVIASFFRLLWYCCDYYYCCCFWYVAFVGAAFDAVAGDGLVVDDVADIVIFAAAGAVFITFNPSVYPYRTLKHIETSSMGCSIPAVKKHGTVLYRHS